MSIFMLLCRSVVICVLLLLSTVSFAGISAEFNLTDKGELQQITHSGDSVYLSMVQPSECEMAGTGKGAYLSMFYNGELRSISVSDPAIKSSGPYDMCWKSVLIGATILRHKWVGPQSYSYLQFTSKPMLVNVEGVSFLRLEFIDSLRNQQLGIRLPVDACILKESDGKIVVQDKHTGVEAWYFTKDLSTTKNGQIASYVKTSCGFVYSVYSLFRNAPADVKADIRSLIKN